MTDTQEDFAISVIFILAMIVCTIIFEAELWAALDWILTTTENFNGRHK
jgi:hypothetical protein